jgi:hypothetical protein
MLTTDGFAACATWTNASCRLWRALRASWATAGASGTSRQQNRKLVRIRQAAGVT